MAEKSLPRRVLKLGGSLLSLPDWAERLDAWRRRHPGQQDWLVVGGGPAADSARRFAERWRLTDQQLHWLCARAMQDNALRCRLRWADRIGDPPPTLLDPIHFLREVDPVLPGQPLPWTDEATSDSIAARTATWLDAELVLFKSRGLGPRDWSQAAGDGLVDACFPKVAEHVRRITWINLRETS